MEQNCLDGKPLATLKKSRTARKLSGSELPTVFWMPPLSSETLESSSATVTPQHIRDWLMLLPEDSPASPSVSPDSKEVQTIPEICGLQQSSAFASYDHESHSWKTSQASLLTNTYEPFSGTWPKQGIMLGGVCWERTIVDVATEESEYGYLPTPDCSDRRSMKSKQWGLSNYIKAGLWPTPRQSEWKGTGPVGSKSQQHMKDRNYLCAVLETGGQLNPTWVEWLMNWPLGWTSLEPMPKNFKDWRNVGTWWQSEPADVPRVASGVKDRVSRLKAIGNGQVPRVVATAFKILTRDLICSGGK